MKIELADNGLLKGRFFGIEQTIGGDLQITNSNFNTELTFNVNGNFTLANVTAFENITINESGKNEIERLRNEVMRLKKKIKELKYE